MWLAVKYGARKPLRPLPDRDYAEKELGSPEAATRYFDLANRYPEVGRGPNEEVADHYKRLKEHFKSKADEQAAWRAQKQEQGTGYVPSVDRPVNERAGDRVVAPMTLEDLDKYKELARQFPDVKPGDRDTYGLIDQMAHYQALKEHQRRLEQGEPPEPSPSSSGLPRRDRGWYVGDNPLNPAPPGFGRPSESPRYDYGLSDFRPVDVAPQLPTHDEWMRGLADKGIYLRPDGTRMSPDEISAADAATDYSGTHRAGEPEMSDEDLRNLPQNAGGLGQSWIRRVRGPKRPANAVVAGYIHGVLVDVEGAPAVSARWSE